jgi:hypothetical protein
MPNTNPENRAAVRLAPQLLGLPARVTLPEAYATASTALKVIRAGKHIPYVQVQQQTGCPYQKLTPPLA